MREIDLNKFLTVDSVGEIDINDDDLDVDALLNDSELGQDNEDDDNKGRSPVGSKFIKKVQAYYCELCDIYCNSSDVSMDDFSKKHCLLRTHLKAFIRHKDENEKEPEEDENNKSKNEKSAEAAAGDNEKKAADAGEAEENSAEVEANENNVEGEGDDGEENAGDEKLWEDDVDKDLGDLLREAAPKRRGERDDDDEEEDDEDESVLNIDIERLVK